MGEFRNSLWAPWRMEYIAGLETGEHARCFICAAWDHPDQDEQNLVVWRGEHTICLLNRWPYSSGHVLVAPNVHQGEPEDLSEETLLEIMQRTRDAKRILQRALNAQGFNIGMNLGHCAGAGLPEHLHQHVVPRWGGDTNYMAVLSDTKVIPQSLTTVRRLFIHARNELGLA